MGRNEVLITLFSLAAFGIVLVKAQAMCNLPKVEYPLPLVDDYNKTLKNLCLIAKPAAYAGAFNYCKSRQMSLVKLDSLAVQKALQNFLSDALGDAGNMAFRVDGLWTNNAWKTENGAGATMPADLKWWKDSQAWCGGNSAVVTNVAWPMMKLLPKKMYLDGLSKDMQLYYFCEYK